jgi:hypothetical protein
MQVIFNSQERTLRESVELAFSAGWKVVRVTRSEGLFGHIVAVPVATPTKRCARSGSSSLFENLAGNAGGSRAALKVSRRYGPTDDNNNDNEYGEDNAPRGGGARSATPTFGSRMVLPSVEELARKFGGAISRGSWLRAAAFPPTSYSSSSTALGKGIVLDGKAALPAKKKKTRPSPLASGFELAPAAELKQRQQQTPVAFSSSSPRFGGSGAVTPTSPMSFRSSTQSPLQRLSSSSSSWFVPPPPLLLPRSPGVGIASEDSLGSPSAPLGGGGLLGRRRGSKRADGSPGGLVLAAAAKIERGLLMEPDD